MSGPRSAVWRALLAHVVASVVVLALAGAGAAVLSERVVAEQVTQQSKAETHAIARDVVGPLVGEELRAGDPAAVARLDQAVRSRMKGSSLLRVKVWDQRGRVLYSDETQLIGKVFPLDAEDVEVLRSAGGESSVSDVSKPENYYEASLGTVIEAYVGMRDRDGAPMLVEVYTSATGLKASEKALSHRVTAVALAALAFLALLLVPLSLRLARRVERYERERLAMVRLAVEASADERRRLARELHDGIIQALTGTRYALASVEKQLGDRGLGELGGTVHITTDVLFREIEALRTLTTTLFSSNPGQTDIREVLTGLARSVEERGGLNVRLAVADLPPLPIAVTEALTQVAREALRNVDVHAHAQTATVTVSVDGTDVLLSVADDGLGFDPTDSQISKPGHLGLRLLEAAADRVGGQLEIRPCLPHGTQVCLRVPLGGARPGAQRSSGEWLDLETVGAGVGSQEPRASRRSHRR
ncbi:MAG: two-component system, NarL family, sensor histidine kinase UhpB [Actinomycetota bacterium]|nr:two-component system, NarL family, sensor histidine kinase UhpB [Actinomycetota bacterium]MDQ1666213.1 two-component system, NarL family, sensor histidine kinase UhpB [Actinomycetota bacterium]MDQ1669189.1 two-component system, NarL family, sensor histidine kinase UhpB [Actinomycetota bacterium]